MKEAALLPLTVLPRVAIVFSHPVQNFCPMFRFLAESGSVEPHVFFATGPQTWDEAFGQSVEFGTEEDLACVSHTFLSEGHVDDADRQLSRHQVWKSLSDFDPDVVVIYGFFRRISRLSWWWALLKRCPRVYISDSEDRGEKGLVVLRVLRRPLEAVVLATMTRFFAAGIANEEFYLRRLVSRKRIVRVPFSINRRLYDSSPTAAESREASRKAFGLDGRIVLLTCGKLIERKRQADVIRAISSSGQNNLVLLVVGSGPKEYQLRSLAKELDVDIRFAGFVSPQRLPSLYRAADVYVHPSSHDPHPLAVSEAIFMGLPVIVSDRTGSWGDDDDVRHGVNGFVHPMADIGALARFIKQLAMDDRLRSRFAEASRQIARRQQELANEGFLAEVRQFVTNSTV
jgi:glycosyltransferase involved in cell wall biosynthesis